MRDLLYRCIFVTVLTVSAAGILDGQSEVEALQAKAKQGDASAQYNLGVIHARGQGVPQDFAEAAKWFRMVAEQGDAGAQYNLGGIYARGQGVPRDFAEAAKWFRMAAEQGLAPAQYLLGGMYDNGDGVPHDHAEAAKWFLMAAEQGLAAAQLEVSAGYGLGEDGPRDLVQAHMWVDLAVSNPQGEDVEKLAKAFREELVVQMTPDQIAKARRLAREWTPKTWDELKKEP
jgi:hypothetical protein